MVHIVVSQVYNNHMVAKKVHVTQLRESLHVRSMVNGYKIILTTISYVSLLPLRRFITPKV